MPFAVYLELDPYSTAELQPIVEHVERISPNARTPRRLNIEPHISLAVYDGLDPEPLFRALDRFSDGMRAPVVRLSSVGLFPGPAPVLFAAPVVSAELLALHRDFHAAVDSAGAACWPYYLPGNWVPHVTLGEQLTPEEAGAAISGAMGLWQPMSASLHRISLVAFHPVELLWHRQLPA
ncbi:2'-5' RNA ligase family protein [Rhizobium sp. WYJ-E13]|uniref:2'-5' RNA ligase family protein n=1 Tax=Rhizobium sp. WYJ-E13 TaxID=2849093 RepID=UPI001C1EC087|nr:2'-5' RNA ligase family protein [Rhizobium sp. WYJ-E13]QWW69740.1 2'-5' RNA ligase family protein [Rhizobium sp. WYJ-E13]